MPSARPGVSISPSGFSISPSSKPCSARELGRSMRDGRDVVAVVLERVPSTLALTIPAFFVNIAVGIPAGVYAALHRNSLIDRCVMVMAVTGFAVPSFILAMLLVLIFSVTLGWLPSAGQDSWRNAILPIATMGFGGAALLARFTPAPCWKCWASPISAPPAPRVFLVGCVWRHALQNAPPYPPSPLSASCWVGLWRLPLWSKERVFLAGCRAFAGRLGREP